MLDPGERRQCEEPAQWIWIEERSVLDYQKMHSAAVWLNCLWRGSCSFFFLRLASHCLFHQFVVMINLLSECFRSAAHTKGFLRSLLQKSQMEKKYPAIAGREKGKFIRRRWVWEDQRMVSEAQSVSVSRFRLSTGGTLTCVEYRICQCADLPGLVLLCKKNAPTHSACAHAPEHVHADIMLCPWMCTCILLESCLSVPVDAITTFTCGRHWWWAE